MDTFKNESDHFVLLHFSTKQSAISIQQSINLRTSKKNSEFAVLGGFYMSDSIEFPLKWLRTRYHSKEWAVLLFEIPDSYKIHSHFSGKNKARGQQSRKSPVKKNRTRFEGFISKYKKAKRTYGQTGWGLDENDLARGINTIKEKSLTLGLSPYNLSSSIK
jgi:hypothetical protein